VTENLLKNLLDSEITNRGMRKRILVRQGAMNRRAAAPRKICRDAVLRKIRRANRDSN
jgi:hypothetical protein